MMTSDGLRRLRILALVEGSSLLVLVGVAVPLKHLFDLPVAVKVLGPLHGIAFLAYVVALIDALGTRGLTGRRAGVALLAAVIPGGGFLFARSLSSSPAYRAGAVAADADD